MSRNSSIRQSLLLAAAALLLTGAGFLLPQLKTESPWQTQLFLQMPLAYVRLASLSFDETVADIQWVRFTQRIPDQPPEEPMRDWMANTATSIIDLDPEFLPVYWRSSVILGVLAMRPEAALRITERSIERDPGSWQRPFLASYLCFYELRDFKCGSGYMRYTMELPGHPDWIHPLAARLLAAADDHDAAIALLMRFAQQADNPATRQQFIKRARQAALGRDLQRLQSAVDRYQDEHGERPADLQALVTDGIISAIPKEPFGGQYVLRDGIVTSTSDAEPLKVFFPEYH